MIARKLFYIDTNCLIFARHYIICRSVKPSEDEAYFPQGVKTGKVIVEALDLCQEKQDLVDLCTSNLANYEMNKRFRTSAIKGLFLEYGFPLEAIDGRPQDVMAGIRQLPEQMRQKLDERLKESLDWYLHWDYRQLIRFEPFDPKILMLADPMPFIAPGIDFMDSLHVATALHLGANYFVTNDTDLKRQAQMIIDHAVENGKLSNGEIYPSGEEIKEPMKAVGPKEFLDTVRSTKLKK